MTIKTLVDLLSFGFPIIIMIGLYWQLHLYQILTCRRDGEFLGKLGFSK